MRKNTARHWLHAILDLLPVILIPVFMIYSHRHTIDSGSIEVPQNQIVDFNQQVKNGNFLSNSDWGSYDSSYTSISYNHGALVVLIGNGSNNPWDYSIVQTLSVPVLQHKYLFNIIIESDNFNDFYTDSYGGYHLFNANATSQWIWTCNSTSNRLLIEPSSNNYEINYKYIVECVEVFDLTQMFGSGNEPTIQQFNQWYSDDYYDYTLSHKELLKGYSTIEYNDTDIMSQVVYQLYNSVDKYFNMGNIFNMGNVYDWFNLNIFNGNAPISIYIVWNIVLYEFVMDLLFLLYGLFMWFIDMCKRLMDKPLDSIK